MPSKQPDELVSARPPRPNSGLRPFAVRLAEASRLLGNKAVSDIYDEIGLGNLVAIKDGNKTLITVASIDAYMAALPPARIQASARALKRRQKSPENRDSA